MSWFIFIKIDNKNICAHYFHKDWYSYADILINSIIHSILTQKQDNFYI